MKILQKYYFYFIAICFTFLFWCANLIGQDTNSSADFPKAWEGNWAGDLIILQPGKDSVQIVPMELNIHAGDSAKRWQWQIVYVLDGEKAPRDYELIEIDASKGHYAVDEKNSIILDSYLTGDVLVSRFSVQKSLLITTYRLVGEELWFEICAGNKEETVETGGKGEIPTVLSFPIAVRQIARLKKK